jgi:hypothetical protein
MHPQTKGMIMNAKSTQGTLKTAAVVAGLVAMLLLPTGCMTPAAGTSGGGGGGITISL